MTIQQVFAFRKSDGLLRLRWSWRVVLALIMIIGGTAVAMRAESIPTITIIEVTADNMVVIETQNYPAEQTFTVTMGKMGTRGVGGLEVGTLESGEGGTITADFAIPEELYGDKQIAIRLESMAGYYSFNWFYNNNSVNGSGVPGTGSDGYVGIPTFTIMSVVSDVSVMLVTDNFPADQDFVVTMGAMGSRGIDGIEVGTTNSGEGGALNLAFDIPEALQGSRQIAIRLESASGFYAYNWFYNNTTGAVAETEEAAAEGESESMEEAGTAYSGFPIFNILAVTRDTRVTVMAENLPPDQDFVVTMGAMGTRGVNGVEVATTNSGDGGMQTLTYDVPEEFQGARQIAMRLQSASGYHAFNWFFNNDTE